MFPSPALIMDGIDPTRQTCVYAKKGRRVGGTEPAQPSPLKPESIVRNQRPSTKHITIWARASSRSARFRAADFLVALHAHPKGHRRGRLAKREARSGEVAPERRGQAFGSAKSVPRGMSARLPTRHPFGGRGSSTSAGVRREGSARSRTSPVFGTQSRTCGVVLQATSKARRCVNHAVSSGPTSVLSPSSIVSRRRARRRLEASGGSIRKSGAATSAGRFSVQPERRASGTAMSRASTSSSAASRRRTSASESVRDQIHGEASASSGSSLRSARRCS
mgnify:CR=1 FL=1